MEPNNTQTSKISNFFHSIKKWSLILAIIIVSNIFFSYSTSLFYPAPKYDNFCASSQSNTYINDEQTCLGVGGQWNGNVQKDVNGVNGYCNENYTCGKDFNDANATYERNFFIVLAIIGAALLIVGLVTAIGGSVLTLALAWSGVLSLLIASIRYWSYATTLLQVVILFLALVALVYIAVKKFKN